MRKYSSLVVVGVVVVLFSTLMESCKKHHEDPVKPKLSFTEAEKTVKESDGTITITMTLDLPAPEAIDVTYTLDGTAVDKVAAGTNAAYDYEITSDYLECKIKKGETTGTITIKLYSDFALEDAETILLHIKSSDSDNIEITRDDDMKITITQEDGLGIFLAWGVGTDEHYADVDMDLFLWGEDDNSTLVLTTVGSASASHDSPEFLFLPTAPLNDGNYGLSANYYEGTVSPMNFQISFIPFINGATGTEIDKTGTYTTKNINPWYTSGNDPLLVETFTKTGADFGNFSGITIPDTLSRVASLRGTLANIQREKLTARPIGSIAFPFLKKN